MALKAVIFDVDGVLVQSMESHFRAYQAVFARVGSTVTPEDVYRNEGRRSREVIESLAQEKGIRLSTEELEALNRVKQETFFGFGPMPFYPGVRELVAKLRARGLRVAAVTGTSRVNVNNHFGDFVGDLHVIVTADDVKRTKPDPEPYLTALAKLGVHAEEALVVENATLGVRAAKAAAIRVVAVTSTLSPEMLSEADVIVPTVADVWGVVEGMA